MAERKTVLALGFFDGIHIGHAELVNTAKARARAIGAEPAVMTFDAHPDTFIKKIPVPLINSPEDRVYILDRFFGVKNVYFLHFSEKTMRMHWRDFLDDVVRAYDVAHFVVGHDFTFGYKGEGSAELLGLYAEENRLGCDVIPAVRRGGVVVSSTHIRTLLQDGRLAEANELLGHDHLLSDKVRTGRRLGRTLDAPTINMLIPDGVLVPRLGVYSTRVLLPDGPRFAVTNVGCRPTFGGGRVTVETNILDYHSDLYGERVCIEFCKYLRGEERFDTPELLGEQIQRDIRRTREYFDI